MHVQGMQHNPGCKTIEGELGSAMNKAGAISDENAGDFSKVTCQSLYSVLSLPSCTHIHLVPPQGVGGY